MARIELGAQQYGSSAFLGEALGLPRHFPVAEFQRPGEMDRQVRAKMEELSKRFPKGVEYGIVYTTMFSASMLT